MTIATSDGEVFESQFHQVIGEPVPQEAPLKITVTKEKPAPESKGSVGWSDIAESLKKDLVKFGESIVHGLTVGPKLLEKMSTGEIDPMSDDALKAVNEVAMNFGMGGIATAPLREGVGMFGGKLGTLYDAGIRKRVANAEAELARGVSPEAVYGRHGVYMGPDDLLRYEISDAGAKLKIENLTLVPERPIGGVKPSEANWGEAGGPVDINIPQYETPYPRYNFDDLIKGSENAKTTGPKTVGDILDHPELYKAYPHAAEIPLASPGFDFSSNGFYSYNSGAIMVRGGKEDEMLSTLLHEVNHWVQHQEGFAKGGNPDSFLPKSELYTYVKDKTKELKKVVNQAWNEAEPVVMAFTEVFNKKVEEARKEVLNAFSRKDISYEEMSKRIDSLRELKIYGHPRYRNKNVDKLSEGDQAVNKFIQETFPDLYTMSKTLKDSEKLLNDFESAAYESYLKLYGEYESRLVQRRQKMTDEERRAAPHWNSEEYAKTYPDGIRSDNVK